MKRIESLTEHQKSLLSEYRDKWMEIGLSCEPANRELAEKWCREAYIIGSKVHTAPSGTQYVNSIDLLLTEEEREQLYQRAEREASKLERFTIKERELLCEWMELYMSNIHPNAFYKEADYYRMLEIVNILKQSPPPFAEATEGRQWKDSGEEGE